MQAVTHQQTYKSVCQQQCHQPYQQQCQQTYKSACHQPYQQQCQQPNNYKQNYSYRQYKQLNKFTIPRTLDGGIIGKVIIFIDTDGVKKVRKTYEDFEMLKSEALSLKQIGSYGLNVPKIYKLSQHPNEMIMEYIECEEYSDPRILKAGIESLHAIKSDKFGNNRDGYTLRLKITNTQSTNWCEWWITNRWNILANSLNEDDKKLMNSITNLIPQIFQNHNVIPSLIHGDYNDRNMIIQKNTKKIYFIDSQCYFGDVYYENIQYTAQYVNIQNIKNPVDLLYYAFIYGLLHKTLSFRNSYIWRARTCINKILDQMTPLWPSIYVESNKNIYQFVVLICGTDIFNSTQCRNQNTSQNIASIIETVENYCVKKHNCCKNTILHVLFKTSDSKFMKRQKTGSFIFERTEDDSLNSLTSPNLCIDNSNFWSGTEVVNRYKTIFPNVQQVYVLCTLTNSSNYAKCFSNGQTLLVLNNGKYYVNRSSKKIEII